MKIILFILSLKKKKTPHQVFLVWCSSASVPRGTFNFFSHNDSLKLRGTECLASDVRACSPIAKYQAREAPGASASPLKPQKGFLSLCACQPLLLLSWEEISKSKGQQLNTAKQPYKLATLQTATLPRLQHCHLNYKYLILKHCLSRSPINKTSALLFTWI